MSNSSGYRLSDKIQQIPQALSIYINQLVAQRQRQEEDIVSLSLGEAFFEIPALDFHPDDIQPGYHYTDSRGVLALRRKIADYYQSHYQAQIDPETELLITAGSKAAIFMAMQAVLNPGDDVLIFEPAWLSYQEQARLVGVQPCFIPYDCPIDCFSEHFTDSARLLIINNPNNPAGRIFSQDDLLTVYAQCRAAGIYVLVDEAYSDFVVGQPFWSMARVVPDKDGIIVVNSLSKNMGMSGWRVGYTIASPYLIDALLKLNQHIITCAPSLLQLHMARYFEVITEATLPQVDAVVQKRAKIAEYIDRLGLCRMAGDATFYFFLSIGDFPDTSSNLALFLLLFHGIAVVPGSAYGETTERFIRISIGTESLDRIFAALDTIHQVIHATRFDRQALSERLREQGLSEPEQSCAYAIQSAL